MCAASGVARTVDTLRNPEGTQQKRFCFGRATLLGECAPKVGEQSYIATGCSVPSAFSLSARDARAAAIPLPRTCPVPAARRPARAGKHRSPDVPLPATFHQSRATAAADSSASMMAQRLERALEAEGLDFRLVGRICGRAIRAPAGYRAPDRARSARAHRSEILQLTSSRISDFNAKAQRRKGAKRRRENDRESSCVFASLRLCVFASLRLCVFASLRLCVFASLRLCVFASLRLCVFASLRLCVFASLRLCVNFSVLPLRVDTPNRRLCDHGPGAGDPSHGRPQRFAQPCDVAGRPATPASRSALARPMRPQIQRRSPIS